MKKLGERSTLFDFDWKFHRGGCQGAESTTLDDSTWRSLDLPHDWSIEDIPGTQSPLNPDAAGQVSSGFTIGGTGWYRKTFSLEPNDTGNRFYLQFDGVYMDADVYLNGKLIGNHPYGYTSFVFDVTNQLKFTEPNVIAVQVRNEGQTSRWYSGSGIYRHVWLTRVSPVHIVPWGLAITTSADDADRTTISLQSTIMNRSRQSTPLTLVAHIHDPRGNRIATATAHVVIRQDSTLVVQHVVKLQNPAFWSVDTPQLYTASIALYDGSQRVDSVSSPFGIRTIAFDPVHGFRLNGTPLKLHGGCVHHDNGPLGAMAFDRAEERRVELLKSNGFNAVRCAHNPPSPAFLDACDKLGMLVIDEAFDMWIHANNPHDYHLYFAEWWQRDIESMVLRDRNHPSIILWSIGNEIRGMDTPLIAETAGRLARYVRSLDATRPVTAAVNGVNPQKDAFMDALDVVGYNYARDNYVSDHTRKPARVIFCSESYPLEALQYWSDAERYPWVIGDFVWTAFDYIGEASIGWRGYFQNRDFYPWSLAYCGDIDICGWKRSQSYYRDVLWNRGEPVVLLVTPPVPSFPLNPQRESWSRWHWHDLVPEWSWQGCEGTPLSVVAYSTCDTVELLLNGVSLGKQSPSAKSEFAATWRVPYEPGQLTAVATNGSRPAGRAVLHTAGPSCALRLSADRTALRADGQDLCYITIELTDAIGIRNPLAEDLVTFSVTGPGSIIAVGNANPISLESYRAHQRRAWKGRCMVILRAGRSTGEIRLTASTNGLPPAEVTIAVHGNQ